MWKTWRLKLIDSLKHICLVTKEKTALKWKVTEQTLPVLVEKRGYISL